MKSLLYSAAAMALASSAVAQEATKSVTAFETLRWEENAAIPKGGEIALLIGDPTRIGDVVVQRVKLPANYFVPPHSHPYAETATVISGSIGFGMGDKVDKTGEMAKAGSFFANPIKHVHYVWTGAEPAIIQVQFIGPGGIDYVNPADDPRKK